MDFAENGTEMTKDELKRVCKCWRTKWTPTDTMVGYFGDVNTAMKNIRLEWWSALSIRGYICGIFDKMEIRYTDVDINNAVQNLCESLKLPADHPLRRI